MQSNGDKVSPWRTPILHKKYSDIILSFLIHDFALLYICLITVKSLPLILY